MFESMKYFLRRHEWGGSLGRLNRTLFLMVIDSASRDALHGTGKPTFNTPSNVIRPNQ
jgi:hypothetical protein